MSVVAISWSVTHHSRLHGSHYAHLRIEILLLRLCHAICLLGPKLVWQIMLEVVFDLLFDAQIITFICMPFDLLLNLFNGLIRFTKLYLSFVISKFVFIGSLDALNASIDKSREVVVIQVKCFLVEGLITLLL